MGAGYCNYVWMFYANNHFSSLDISLMVCLVPGKYKGKKKNVNENDFLMFDCPIKYFKEN